MLREEIEREKTIALEVEIGRNNPAQLMRKKKNENNVLSMMKDEAQPYMLEQLMVLGRESVGTTYKAMPRLDVTEVGSEEMDTCYEEMPLLDLSQVGSEEMDPGHQVPDHDGLREDEIPCVGMRFDQLQMAHEFYVTYAKKVGFATKIRTTTCDKLTNQPINQAIHCNRDGFRVSRVKASTRKNRISAAGCKARIYVKFDKEAHDWVFFKVELSHSHPCSARKAVHYHEYRQLTMHAKCVIEDNDEAGIRPNKTFLALANESGGPSNLGYSEKDLRNYITARLRTSNVNVDVREMMNYFMRMKDINPNFFYAVNLDDDCKFRGAVWVDARCRASFEYYGDVVSLDSTYSTNKHGLPFASFVGVNHHGKSTILGCALLGNEEIPSYEWVFRQWVKCMGIAPQRIITDQCKSIFRAIKNVFPDTRHRWCIWHITKKLPHKLGGYRRYRELYDEFSDIVWNSRTEQSFEDNWYELIDEHNLHNNTWLSDLFDDRRMWVPIYFKGEFWAAMRSTQRSESMHSFYGNFLHSRTSLVQFVHEYDNVLGIKEQRELEDDAADSRGVEEEIPVNEAILCIPYDVHFERSTQEVRCECNLFESSGVLCCHCLAVFHYYKVYKVPNRYVLSRWSKNIKRKHTYVKSSHDVSRSDESHIAFRGLCAHFYNVAQDFVNDDEETALLHAALEETRAKLTAHRAKKRSESVADSHNNIGSTSLNVSTVMDIQAPSKVNTKGRPKSKRLGAALEKSIKKSARKRNKPDPPVVCPKPTQDVRFGGVVGHADPEQVGGFMSLLSSFNKN
ncbi:protein FAR1-RELATED SEQUENCE 6-like [Arachis duranensis]|uniref:Protein FAR1-RELATED SEQUENCE 6-like n=1 Tax=Arachis duranensis TaxID=130453 RepID=A0A6P5MYS8_ARADU|nr:protein FAR1-RELATED SEQUENCE 6-like [Arachis duranensis]